jgi:hypothetical protein
MDTDGSTQDILEIECTLLYVGNGTWLDIFAITEWN